MFTWGFAYRLPSQLASGNAKVQLSDQKDEGLAEFWSFQPKKP